MMGDWVLDSLVGFLKSPRWTHPLSNFVDENCVVFDPGEENKFSYTDVHKQYSSLVETLLEQFMEDIGMSSKQFIQAWEKCGENCNFEKGITQQIVAADDFLCFKVMMVQRNIDLEKKAWELVKQQRKSTNFQEPPPSYGAIVYSDDENALQQALEMSKREYELRRQTEEEELRHLIAMAEAQWATERQCVKLRATVPTAPMLATVPTAPMLATVPTAPMLATVPTAPIPAIVPTTPIPVTVPTAPIPAIVPTAPMLATVPTAPIPAIVPTTPIPVTVPTAPIPAIVPTTPIPTTVPTAPIPATVPTASIPAATVPSKWASTADPVEGSCMSTMPDIDQHLPSEETWTEDHTPQLLAETTESPVGGVSHTPQPQAETVGCEVRVNHTSQGPDHTSQGPDHISQGSDHYKPDSLGSPPGHCDLSGAEAAALWILSAREELSSSPPKESLESQESHMRRQRDHLLQLNKEQRDRELQAFIANPPASTPHTAVEGTHRETRSAFSWFKRGKREVQKVGRTGILCTAIASKLKKSDWS